MVSGFPFEISTLFREPHSIERSAIPNRAQLQSRTADFTDDSVIGDLCVMEKEVAGCGCELCAVSSKAICAFVSQSVSSSVTTDGVLFWIVRKIK